MKRMIGLFVILCAGLFAVALITLLWAGSRPELALVGYFVGLSLFALGDGITSVPWTDIVGRTVPHQRRGRLFGTMQVLGGILAFGAGFAVRRIIAHPALPYPYNFALLFFIGAALLMLSSLSFSRVREPATSLPTTMVRPEKVARASSRPVSFSPPPSSAPITTSSPSAPTPPRSWGRTRRWSSC